MENKTLPRFPLFVPTKGRYETLHTIKALEKIGCPYSAVIEKQEYEQYSRVIDKKKIIVLPHQNEGLTVTRNWIWDYAQNELKTEYFWTMDDNIRSFRRLHKNTHYIMRSPVFLRCIEDFTMRYSNVYISGMAYQMFIPRRLKCNPFSLNTRIYSNMLIKTDIPYRNQLFYNDDTDLCLRILKDGFCTVQFNAFLVEKIATMKVKGGMTDYYKQTEKRKQFAEELAKAHPDVVTVVKKFNRWHHEVNYQPFKNNRPILKNGIVLDRSANNYGMNLLFNDEKI